MVTEALRQPARPADRGEWSSVQTADNESVEAFSQMVPQQRERGPSPRASLTVGGTSSGEPAPSAQTWGKRRRQIGGQERRVILCLNHA